MRRDDGGRRQFKRDLPAPPRKSEDNYAAALSVLYRDLDEAELVAPTEADRKFVQDVRDDVRTELLVNIKSEDADD